ncbi:MAG: helix-turn-helix transcriptional regulator [Candidatus Cloacimonetes bacterium]|nr:helix-turn-helix transcriptional regulator [Candidatus Cloacimonadota bacterium]
MSYNIDFSVASCKQIESALCSRLEQIRLSRNLTQSELANEAGVSVRTITRMEKGEGISLNTFIRVLTALNIQQNLELLLPDPSVQPIERVKNNNGERKRARSKQSTNGKKNWVWGEEEINNG